jgi:tryptophan synthase alpha chain
MESEASDSRKNDGRRRISQAFRRAAQTKTAALMPYFTLGYPDLEQSLKIIKAIAPYSDLLELGVPFSDPIADGPTIQRSTQLALDQGINTTLCLRSVRRLREAGVDTPILLMGYYNPILAYGESRYVHDAAEAGADGFIVPDLPPEEAATLTATADEHGLALVYFLAPTSDSRRIERVIAGARGFIYMVSVTGVTGARNRLSGDLAQLVKHVRSQSDLPVAVGFGIGTPEQATEVGKYADGVIVGSALINAVDQATEKPAAAAAFVRSLEIGLRLD